MITASEQPTMILMLTAADSPGERVAGLALGADDYLAKEPLSSRYWGLRACAPVRRSGPSNGPSRLIKSA
jgi:DNA-binding response OmpR family regulator